MKVNLVHYSKNVLPELKPVTQSNDEWSLYKPDGFWVSCEHPNLDPASEGDAWISWVSWCQREEFGLDRLQHRAILTLTADAKLLWLTSEEEILDFNHKFRTVIRRPMGSIDWPRVTQYWQGIVIAPYQWKLRLHPDTMWYYTWDCASGCIWDVSAIGNIERGKGYTTGSDKPTGELV